MDREIATPAPEVELTIRDLVDEASSSLAASCYNQNSRDTYSAFQSSLPPPLGIIFLPLMNIVSAGGVKQNIYPCDLYPTDLNGEPEFEPVERVADPDLALDLRVHDKAVRREQRHDFLQPAIHALDLDDNLSNRRPVLVSHPLQRSQLGGGESWRSQKNGRRIGDAEH